MKLFGIIDSDKSSSQIEQTLRKMAESFRVESSVCEQFCDHDVGIGHLSNADLEENSLIFTKDRSLCIMVCGRLFDFEKKEDKFAEEGYGSEGNSAAEFILHCFEKYGKSFAINLNGIFVIVIWDRKNDELTIINDRYGMKPLYYHEESAKLVFASEVKAIIATEHIRKEIDWDGWRDIFSYGYVLGDKTLFRNILSLPPASIFTFKNATASIASYWRYEDIKVDYGKTEEYFVDRGLDVIRDSILKQTRGVQKTQVLLSGGYDSRAIVCGLKSFTNVSFKTFTGILHAFGSKDAEYARLLSRKLGFENLQVLENNDVYRRYFVDMIYFMDGLSFEHLWAMPVAKRLTAGIPSFDGIAGDIVFDEIHSLPFDKLRRKHSREETVSIIYQNINLRNNKLYRFFNSDIQTKIRPTNSSIRNEVAKLTQTDYLFSIFFIRNKTKNSVSLISNNIVSNKTLSLFPFLENDLVQLSMSMPPDMKVRKQIYQRILRKAFPEAMKIPTTHEKSLLEIFLRSSARIAKKILIELGFVTIFDKLNMWLSEHLDPSLVGYRLLALPPKKEDLVYLENLVKSLDLPSFIHQDYLFKQIASHKCEKQDYGYFLVPIASFCLWYDLFYKDHPDKPEDIKRRVE